MNGGEYDDHHGRFRGSTLLESGGCTFSEYFIYAEGKGLDIIDVAGSRYAIKASKDPVLAYKDSEKKPLGNNARISPVKLTNILGNRPSTTDWLTEYKSLVDYIFLISRDPNNYHAALIPIDLLTEEDIKVADDGFSILASKIYYDRFIRLDVPTSIQGESVKGIAQLGIDTEITLAVGSSYRREYQKYINSLTDEQLEQNTCRLLDTKDQNESSLTQLNYSPTSVEPILPSTDLVEQGSSVQPCVSTV